MGFDDIENKAKGLLDQHQDQANEGIDKARDMVDEKTGGKHSEQIDKAAEQAKNRLTGNQR
jgi:hypothetical protein